MPRLAPAFAFTLVELLVVVTILVVLMALLAPGLDKGVYEAELAICGSQLNAMATGLNTYALDFRRHYPVRPAVEAGGTYYPYQLSNAGLNGETGFDDRPTIRGYVDLGLLVDPLCRKIRLDVGSTGPGVWVYSSYALWFGWSYIGYEGMTRMGNRLTWTDDANQLQRVTWLATDLDALTPAGNNVQGSHPDRNGLMHNEVVQAGGQESSNPVVIAVNQISKLTKSMWTSVESGFKRGIIEMNAVSADGAISRFQDLPYDGDPRMARASPTPTGTPSALTWLNVPAR